MPVRYYANTWTRDKYREASNDYRTHPDSLRQVLAWYRGERAEYSDRSAPDLWEVVKEDMKDGRRRLVLHQLETDEAIELTYKVNEGTELDHSVRPLPPEEAYQLALDLDERAIARGENRINERHPLPVKP